MAVTRVAAGACVRLLVLGTLGDEALGRQHEAGDARRVLERRADDLGRVDDARP